MKALKKINCLTLFLITVMFSISVFALTPAEVHGNRSLESGDYESAIDEFDRAIELNPEHASAYFYRGRAKLDLDEYFEAFLDFLDTFRLGIDQSLTNFVGP